jgi:hypothetical protein
MANMRTSKKTTVKQSSSAQVVVSAVKDAAAIKSQPSTARSSSGKANGVKFSSAAFKGASK